MEKILDYSLKVTIALLIITIPLVPKWGNYSLVLLGVIALAIYSRNKVWNNPPFIFYFLMGAYAIRIIWLLNTNDFYNGLKSLETEAPLAAVPLVFCFFKLSDETRRQFLKLYVVTAFLVMIYAFLNLIVYIGDSPLGFLEYMDVHLGNRKQMSEANMLTWRFAHPSFLSMFVLYALSIFFFLRPKMTGDKIFFVIYVIAGLMFTLLSGSRAGVSLMFLSLVLFMIIELRSYLIRKVPLFIFAAAVAAAIFFFVNGNFRAGPGALDTFRAADTLRTITIIKATKAFAQKPIFGYGTSAEKEIIRDEHLESIGYTIYHPHNQYLTELLQFGIIGSLPLFLFVVLAIVFSIRNQFWDLLCIMIIFSVFMIFESPVNSNKGIVPFMIAIVLTGFNNGIVRKAGHQSQTTTLY